MYRTKSQSWVALLFTLAALITAKSNAQGPFQNQTWPLRVLPGQISFPLTSDFYRLSYLLKGDFITPHDPRYGNMTLTWNLRVIKSPFGIAYPHSIEDIQRIILFSRQFNLHVSIRSSGHSFIGRSTHDGSINLNLAKMADIQINLKSTRNPAGEITVQSGASWLDVYKKVNATFGPDESGSGSIGRVVVGGSAHTVAMGGYTLGGGHSPIGRKFGLAVDNLLEATIVTAEGHVVTASAVKTVTRNLDGIVCESSDTSLFWAIRGGGGGTWGVVVSFTYKLHYAPKRFRKVVLVYPLFQADGTPLSRSDVTTVLTELNKMSEDWGGYFITSGGPVAYTPYFGSVLLMLNHYGNDSSPSNKEIDGILQRTKPIYKTDENLATFLDYEIMAKDGPNGNVYIASTFVKRSTITTDSTLDTFVDFIYDEAKKEVGCTMTMVGGRVMESNKRPATPMHPGIRSGLFATTCGVGWEYNPLNDKTHIIQALDMAQKLYPFGYGSYFNEPAEDMADWKIRFWADNATYDSLLKVKQMYDPTNYFWCHNCVASDRGYRYGPPDSRGVPGQPTLDDDQYDFTRDLNTPVAHPCSFGLPIVG